MVRGYYEAADRWHASYWADPRVFAVLTVRDGRLIRVHDHTERAKGLEAAGL